MGFNVVEVQATPNPHAKKFVIKPSMAAQPVSFLHHEAALEHPIASRLFEIQGITSVLMLGDFVTVNKDPAATWPPITRQVRDVLKKS